MSGSTSSARDSDSYASTQACFAYDARPRSSLSPVVSDAGGLISLGSYVRVARFQGEREL